MLNSETKRKIDSLRDTLVGRLPTPNQQVEQITLGLIYKFMHDLDEQKRELGDKASFFTGEFSKYAWNKLMAKSLAGHERASLYAEGLEAMSRNPKLPQLFRDIFKRAYLPFRDAAIIQLFLQQIDEFSYEHSEDLGDAFEYLLQVMGTQGDAGQFRTPRHIIDFIVSVVEPDKNMRVLDPACGTAGFLIGAYKYILAENKDASGKSTLTAGDRRKIAKNFTGYDMSGEMVRLSLVNMYLHNFPEPQIYEYDTLGSEERWNEKAECIIANPPFMSPKGGIRPHTKFTLKANRSEVLFVDYIIEHLTTDGRAGIIVPEGIIFTSAKVYKDLRKWLVDEKLLYAVISLPAGVFQPYSGVKTSILLIDKEIAKRSENILFVKIENDGLSIGAQRREIEKNDLPDAKKKILEYKKSLKIANSPNYIIVPKEKIGETGDYNLSVDRYGILKSSVNQKWPLVVLGDICDVRDGTHDSPKYALTGYPLITSKNVVDGKIDFNNVNLISKKDLDAINKRSNVDDGDIIMPMIGTIGNPIIIKKDREFAIKNVALIKFHKDSVVLNSYVRSILDSSYVKQVFENSSSGSTQKFISLGFIRKLQIPLPPLSVQEELVAELERYQRIIDGARQIVANYKPEIDIDPKWEMVALGEACKFIDYRGKTPTKTSSGIPLITAKNVKKGFISEEPREYIAEKDYDSWMTRGLPKNGDVLFTTEAPLGNVALLNLKSKVALAQRIITLRPNGKMDSTYLLTLLLSEYFQNEITKNQSGSTVMGIKASILRTIKIPIPPQKEQEAIVKNYAAEQAGIDSAKTLITLYESKIRRKIGEVWGKDEG